MIGVVLRYDGGRGVLLVPRARVAATLRLVPFGASNLVRGAPRAGQSVEFDLVAPNTGAAFGDNIKVLGGAPLPRTKPRGRRPGGRGGARTARKGWGRYPGIPQNGQTGAARRRGTPR